MAMAIRLPETGAAQVDERRRRVARTRASPTPRSEAAASASSGPSKPVNPSGPVPPAVVVGDTTADVGDGVVGDGDGDGEGEESWLVEHLGGGRVVRRASSRHIHLTISSRVELVALDGDPVADDVDRLGGEGGEREGSWPPGWCRSSRRQPDPE